MHMIREKLYEIYNWLLILMTSVLTCLALYQVLARYAFGWPLSWTEELMRYMFCAIVMLGMATVIREDSFITVTLLPNAIKKRSPSLYKALGIFRLVVQIAFFALLLYFGGMLAYQSRVRNAATLQVPFVFVYMCLPLGGLFGGFESVLKLVELLKTPIRDVNIAEEGGFQ